MRHILLVDDEPEILEGLALILQPLPDVTLHTAYLASQALQIMEQQPIVLVIADIRMPGMNGIEMWEQIQRRAPQCRVIFLSGVRDFDNIYRVIQSPGARFLTKMEPEEKILATVEDVLMEVESQQQKQLDSQLSELAAYVTSETQGMPVPTLPCQPALIFMSPACQWAMPPADKKEAAQVFHKALCTVFRHKAHCLPLRDSDALYLLPTAEGGYTQAQLLHLIRQTCVLLETNIKGTFRCAFAEAETSAERVRIHYQAFRRWRFGENVPHSHIQPLESLPGDAQQTGHQTKLNQHLRTLQGYIKLGQLEGFRQLALRMFQEAQKINEPSFLADVYYSILALLCQQVDLSADPTLHALIQADRRRSFTDAKAQQDAQERLLVYADHVFLQLFPADPYTHTNVVESIRRYIRDHLADDLSLTALSQRFAMNPTYLSRVFRENSGDRLHEYIASQRMSYAAQMLSTSTMRVNEIARKAGYDTVHTFIRSFRKQFGCTPLEYRTRHQEPR